MWVGTGKQTKNGHNDFIIHNKNDSHRNNWSQVLVCVQNFTFSGQNHRSDKWYFARKLKYAPIWRTFKTTLRTKNKRDTQHSATEHSIKQNITTIISNTYITEVTAATTVKLQSIRNSISNNNLGFSIQLTSETEWTIAWEITYVFFFIQILIFVVDLPENDVNSLAFAHFFRIYISYSCFASFICHW